MRTILVDGDVFAYQHGHRAERAIDWGDGDWTLHADEGEARSRLDSQILELQKTLEADKVVVVLSDSANWRLKVYPLYKSNRKETRKPMILGALRDHMLTRWSAWIRPGLEGDDVLGILSTHPTIIKGERIIVSLDKDMKTIPGLLYNTGKPAEGIVTITEAEADDWHFFQTLMGDATDGYPGCPGVGKVRARAILDTTGEEGAWLPAWPKIVAAYVKAGLTEDDALIQARIARICRATDYDFKKKEVKLWKPS